MKGSMMNKLDEIYAEMVKLHREIQERNMKIDALMSQALAAVQEQRKPVNYTSNAEAVAMHVSTSPHPLAGTIPPKK